MQKHLVTIFLISLSYLALVACSSQDEHASAGAQADRAAGPLAQDAPLAGVPDNNIMETPMDGSSVEAFTQSLAAVKAAAEPQEYAALENALSWLLFYDLSVRGDKAQLYKKLDGETPRQIMARVRG